MRRIVASMMLAALALALAPAQAMAADVDIDAVKRAIERSVVRIDARDCESVGIGTACSNGIAQASYGGIPHWAL